MITIKYTASVYTQAGWRPVTITAQAEPISAGMARVVRVEAIDGDAPVGHASRTGARRQTYNAASIAKRETDARKRLSACQIFNPAA